MPRGTLANTLAKSEPGTLRYQHVRERREESIRAFDARIPRVRMSSSRKGLDATLKARLFVVTRPDAAENPFHKTEGSGKIMAHRRRRKVPKMSAEDRQRTLNELDAWCRRERKGRHTWARLGDVSGFTRQVLSNHPDIVER